MNFFIIVFTFLLPISVTLLLQFIVTENIVNRVRILHFCLFANHVTLVTPFYAPILDLPEN